MPLAPLQNGKHGHHSDTLGLQLWLKGSELRLFDPAKGHELLTQQEIECALEDEATARAAAEARLNDVVARANAEAQLNEVIAARMATEAKAAALKAQLRKLTGK